MCIRDRYWEERARSALLHAKYKERPDVRWRRIKKIEADLRKAEKTIADVYKRQAELLASLIQTAEQALWKREWAAWDHGLAVQECVTRRQAVVNQVRICLLYTSRCV